MTDPHATTDDGRPSAAARVRLAADLHDQLATSRMAWDAALLRSDAALASGDEAEVQAALADHRRLLGVLEERLGAVVAAATVTREAEQVVGDSAPVARHDALAANVHVAPPTGPSGSAPRHGPARSAPGHRLVGALAGAAAAVALLAGVLGGDLRLGTDGMIAGTSTQEDDVRARVAATAVVAPELGDLAGIAGPRAALPRFSGTLPATPPPTDRPATDDEAADAAVPGPDTTGRAPDDRDGAPSASVPERDVPTTLDVPEAPSLPRPEELIERLAERDGDDGADVGSSLPSPLAEVVELLPELPIEPPASDPTGGLG